MIGIYGIKNKVNGKIYIGQSIEIERRYKDHMRDLKKKRHANAHLSNSFNIYGENSWELIVLEECEKEQLSLKEEKWINSFAREQIYNENFFIINLTGERNPFFGKKHKIESKKKMSKWKSENYSGESNPNFGKKQSKEVRLKMTLNRSCATSKGLKIEDILEIKELLLCGTKHKIIAEKFGVARTVITRISNGTRWANVTGGAVVPVIYDNNGTRKLSPIHRKNIRLGRKGKKNNKEEKCQ